MENMVNLCFCVAGGGTVRGLDGAIYLPGDIVEESMFSPDVWEMVVRREFVVQTAVVVTQEDVPAKPLKDVPKWNFNPADLVGKSLEDLNLMIVDRDGVPQTSVKAAVKLLSSEYQV